MANSDDSDESNAAFHQGLHCLLKQNQSLEKEKQYCQQFISDYTLERIHTNLILGNSFSHARIQKIPPGGGGGVLTLTTFLCSFFLVINAFH